MVCSWSSGSPRTISPPTAPQPKPSTESRIPVRPNTRISIAVPPPAERRSRYSKLRISVMAAVLAKKSTGLLDAGANDGHFWRLGFDERCKRLLGSRAKPGGIHAYRYHWRRIGWRDAGASLDQAWRGRDLGTAQSRRSETCGATQGARQSASRGRQGGRGRRDRDALVRGRGGDQEPGQPRGYDRDRLHE